MIEYCNFRNILFAYVVLFLALTFPYWLNGEVIAPYRQTEEIAAPEIKNADHIENKKFSDYVNYDIPEISVQLNSQRSAWLAMWTNQNELGRPLMHVFGLSRAYLPSWLIACFTDNPHRFFMLLSLGTCFLAGFFVLMLCRELQLLPLAGLLAAGGLVTSPVLMYWLTFPMFASVLCWSTGVMYALTKLTKKNNLIGWCVLAFSTYSLLMTAYQQLIVFHFYILIGYGSYLAYRQWRTVEKDLTIRYLITIASASIVGGVLTLPVYLDLASAATNSARVAPNPAYFASYLPYVDSLNTAIKFLVLSLSPEIFGNPISPSWHFVEYAGLSTTPLVNFLALIGLILCIRKLWGWWLAVIIICVLAFNPSMYLFGVKYLGLNLSPINPLYCVSLPLTLIAAYGADALIRRVSTREHSYAIVFATSASVAILLIAIGFGLTQKGEIRWERIVTTLAIVIFLAAQFDRIRPALLIAALVTTGSIISFPMMLRQEPTEIATSSKLVEMIRENLRNDSHYAVAYPGINELPANLNATLKLPSVHSYDSLSSQYYHTLLKVLRGNIYAYGRWNDSIAPNYNDAMLWMSNIAIMLSPSKLVDKNLDYLGQIGNVHLHRVISRMGCCQQVILSQENITHGGVKIENPKNLLMLSTKKIIDQGDLLEFDVQDENRTSLLILSQLFHNDWHAQLLTESGWVKGTTVPVNGVFQGVLLPERVQKVKIQFKPYVRFAWIAHVFWLVMLTVLIVIQILYISRKLSK